MGNFATANLAEFFAHDVSRISYRLISGFSRISHGFSAAERGADGRVLGVDGLPHVVEGGRRQYDATRSYRREFR